MKDLMKYPILLTALLYFCFAIGANSFDYTEWSDLSRTLFAYLLFCIWGITMFVKLISDKQ